MPAQPLSVPALPTQLRHHYDWVILGSEAAAAWVASRLAARGQTVALLESEADFASERPDVPSSATDALRHHAWPAALRDDAEGLAKAAACVAQTLGEALTEAQVVVSLLHDAGARGAAAFLSCRAAALTTHPGGGWSIDVEWNNLGRETFHGPLLRLRAENVVVALGAGTAAFLKNANVSPASSISAGCNLGDDGGSGAADGAGRLFADQGTEIRPRLFLAGRATWPAEVPGCRLREVLALAERNLAIWLGGAAPAYSLLPPVPQPVAVGLRFTEAMRGFVSRGVTAQAAFEAGFTRGKDEGSRLEFVLTLETQSVDAMVRDPRHPAKSVGTVVAPALDAQPVMVAGGDFNLFVDQSDKSRRMQYRMQLLTGAGRCFFFDGFKVIRDDPGIDVWADTTTLYVTIFDGPDDSAPVWGRGIMHILPADFARQLGTFKTFGARNPWQAARAQVAFGRLFLGTLFETYAGAAAFLPDARKRGSLPKIAASSVGWLVFAAAALMFWVWPWRSPMMRNQAELVPLEAPLRHTPRMASSWGALAAFPSLVRNRSAQAAAETATFHCAWVPDNLVQTHGGIGDVPFHPADIARFSEPGLRRGFINLTRIRDGQGRVVGVGSQLETIIANGDAVARRSIDAYTDWTLLFPGKGVLFLGQVEGGPDLAQLSNQVAKSRQPWKGDKAFNRSLGPLADGRGLVHAGTGIYRNAIGSFREFNIVKEVPVQGDIVADTRYELNLLAAPPQPHEAIEVARGLKLPPSCSAKLDVNLPWHVVKRRFSIDPSRDLVYSTAGQALQQPAIPASLGPLVDEDLAHTRVFLAKLRDEHGVVVGLAAASSWQPPQGAGYLSQWTLLVSGVGTLYVAPDGEDGAQAPARGYFGESRGLILGGTGDFFDVTGVVQERWPVSGSNPIAFDVDLVTNRL